jgi:ABC-2 type transport system ATP-binding protein
MSDDIKMRKTGRPETGRPEIGEIILETRDLGKRFDDIVAVDNVSFTIRRGEVMGLLGGNGAGKTTTIGMLLGLVLPSQGEISIFGIDMLRRRHSALPRMNFSSPYVDLPHRLTVRQNLTVYGHLYGLSGVQGRIETLARELDLSDLLNRGTGSLSAGQKTRVALAKSLINEPELLLLDEPTASLDPDTADWVRGYLSDYQDRVGASILLASHNMAEVERMCHDVVMLRRGKVVDKGAPDDLIRRYGRQDLEEVFLDIARATEAAE